MHIIVIPVCNMSLRFLYRNLVFVHVSLSTVVLSI